MWIWFSQKKRKRKRKEVSLNEFLMGRITLRGENVSIHRAHSHQCIHTHTHVCTRANLLSLLSLTLLLQITSPRCCTANTSASETWQPGPAASRPWRTTSLCTTTTSSSPTTRVSGWTGTARRAGQQMAFRSVCLEQLRTKGGGHTRNVPAITHRHKEVQTASQSEYHRTHFRPLSPN